MRTTVSPFLQRTALSVVIALALAASRPHAGAADPPAGGQAQDAKDDPLYKFVQLSERLDKAAADQLKLYKETARVVKQLMDRQKPNPTLLEKQRLAKEYPGLCDEQRRIGVAQKELATEIIDLLNEAGALKTEVAQDQKTRLITMQKLAEKQEVMTTFYRISPRLSPVAPDESWRTGNTVQKRLAAELKELAAILTPPGSRPERSPSTEQQNKSGAPNGEFERLHAMIKPGPGEWKFATIPWVPTIAEARVKAAKEGKPLLIWYMVGEPLGQC